MRCIPGECLRDRHFHDSSSGTALAQRRGCAVRSVPAWKKTNTEGLVAKAIESEFRAIDTGGSALQGTTALNLPARHRSARLAHNNDYSERILRVDAPLATSRSRSGSCRRRRRVAGRPRAKVTFEIYFLAIVATSLRYDARICVAVGMLAVAQYAALWAFAAMRYDLGDPAYAVGVGEHAVIDQVTRLILMTAAVVLAYAIVRRAQRLLHLAARDRLTGAYNRGHFDVTLAHEAQHALRNGQPLTCGSRSHACAGRATRRMKLQRAFRSRTRTP
jgi:hypothetical protein